MFNQATTMFGGEAFKKAWDDQVGRYEAGVKELVKLEERGVEQTRSAIDEWARLSRESIAYGVAMQTQWRDASLETMRRFTSFAATTPAK